MSVAAPRTPDAVAPPPGHPRFPYFDSLRAIAAISVLLVHASLFTGPLQSDHWWRGLIAHLDIGVTIFFLISGFLLYRPMVAARQVGAPRTALSLYARRRFLRIAPAYWFALTVLTIFAGLHGAFSGNWWVYYGLFQDYPVYTPTGGCATDLFRCGIAPTWSLAVEVGFYIVLPFFALGMAWLTSRLRVIHWLFVELVVLALLAAVSFWIQNDQAATDLHVWLFFSPLGRAWWFALGMVLAVLSVRVQERGSAPRPLRWIGEHPTLCWVVALSLYALAALVLIDPVPTLAGRVVTRAQYLTQYFLFGVIALFLLLPAVFGDNHSGLPRRVLGHPVIAWLGLISYGIFLWHFPILEALLHGGIVNWWPAHAYLVTAATTFAITIVCASISYYALERPLMRLKNRRRQTSVTAADRP